MSRGEYQYFPSKVFRLTVPKIIVCAPFIVSLISGMEKIFGGLRHDFPSKIFQSRGNAVFQKFSGA